MDKDKYDVVVIGTGIGGSACGALLAQAGLKTLILEKNGRIGGICSSYEKQGFHVDYGTHMFSRGGKGPLGEVERRLNIPGRINFVQASPLSHFKGLGFDLIQPDSGWGAPKFYYHLLKQLGLPLSEAPNFIRMISYLSLMPDKYIDKWNHRSMEEFLLQFTDNPRVFSFFGLTIGLFFVLPFWEASAGETIYCSKLMARDNALSYPMGGAVAVPQTYVDAGKDYGAKVLTSSNVSRIHVKSGAVTSVETKDGRQFAARAVVSSTSLKSTVFNLVGRRYFPSSYVKMVEDIKQSFIAVQAKIALKRKVFKAGVLTGFSLRDKSLNAYNLTRGDIEDMYNDTLAGRIPRIVPLYCPIPTNHDPGLAPPGKQLLTLCCGAPTLDVNLMDPYSKWIDAMLEAFEDTWPEVKGNIEWIDTFDVKFIEHWNGKLHGPAISTGQTMNQVVDQRPSIRSPIRGLYFAGDCAGGRGIGTELAADSAMACADELVSDFHHNLL